MSEPKSKFARRNAALSEQIKILNINSRNDRLPKALTVPVTFWQADGEDHINISSHGKTSIGVFLAHDSNYEVVSPKFGRFSSVRNLWLWLKTETRDDRLRNFKDRAASSLYRSLRHRDVPNFRAIILDTDWNKLKQYPAAAEAFKNNDLPLDTYFYDRGVDNAIPRRYNTFSWLIEGWEELRNALREEREPNLNRWLDVPGSGIYDFAFGEEGHTPGVLERPDRPRRIKRFQSAVTRPVRKTTTLEPGAPVPVGVTGGAIDASKDAVLSQEVSVVEIPQSLTIDVETLGKAIPVIDVTGSAAMYDEAVNAISEGSTSSENTEQAV